MATNASVERTLGLVLGKLEAIDDRLERADESRSGLHRRMDDLVMRTGHLEANVGSIAKKVEDMEKVTVEVTTLRTKAQGAGTLGKWLIRLGIGVVMAAGWMMSVYTWLTGRPPP
ncbi:hypothetical protein ASD64_08870 [Mesorhizobium sp. Root157]|uniref:DUF1515 family protein n=1 Tax=Mesorhizobium sp. Root157 TaxID=1736477 RepID=UPI0006FBC7B8|nr:DUF1515 family protein [Mesorhizobium sp. Root157]KQZ81862.1 hypothetical protein ASD64_08870 [Mesorhizobium sp. Root157]